MKKITVVILTFALLVTLCACGAISNFREGFKEGLNSAHSGNQDTEESMQEYIESCQVVAYDDIARDPDEYKGTHVMFTGSVIQVAEGSFDSVTYRVATSGSYDDIVYVTYTHKDEESRILENDNIKFYGDCNGVTSYMSVLGGKITIPSVKMKYFTINSTNQTETDGEPLGNGGSYENEGALGDYYVEIKDAYLTTDYDGDTAIVITYAWTNNSSETTTAWGSVTAMAFQDGVEIDRATMRYNQYDSEAEDKNVRPGTTIDVQIPFKLSSETSEIEVEFSETWTWEKSATVYKTFDPAILERR